MNPYEQPSLENPVSSEDEAEVTDGGQLEQEEGLEDPQGSDSGQGAEETPEEFPDIPEEPVDRTVDEPETTPGDALAQLTASAEVSAGELQEAKGELDRIAKEERQERKGIGGQAKEVLQAAASRLSPRLLPALAMSFSVGCQGVPGMRSQQEIERWNDAIEFRSDEQQSVESLDADAEPLADHLRESVTEESVQNVLSLGSVSSVNERREQLQESDGGYDNTAIGGFESAENFPDLDEQDWQILFDKVLPIGVAHSLEGVAYHGDKRVIDDEKGSMLEDKRAAAQAVANGVEYYDAEYTDPEGVSQFFHTFVHEAAHVSDWESNKLMTTQERLALYDTVLDRLDDEDRYVSNYVEMIEPDDTKEVRTQKAIEYFAEIFEAYYKHEPLLPEADKRIVEDFIAKMDPSFDKGKANMYYSYLFYEHAPELRKDSPDIYETTKDYFELVDGVSFSDSEQADTTSAEDGANDEARNNAEQ